MGFFKTRRPILAAGTELSGGAGGPLNNFTAVLAPTANDDTGDGYEVGSQWLDTITGLIYFAKDVTLAAVVWELQNPHIKRVLLDKGSQSLTTAVTADVIWATETYDDGAWFDVGTSATQIIVPSGITRIHASIRATFAANATGQRFVSLSKGGVAFAQTRVDATVVGNTVLTVAGDIDVAASDVITATAFQDSGGNLNITGNSQIGIHAIG